MDFLESPIGNAPNADHSPPAAFIFCTLHQSYKILISQRWVATTRNCLWQATFEPTIYTGKFIFCCYNDTLHHWLNSPLNQQPNVVSGDFQCNGGKTTVTVPDFCYTRCYYNCIFMYFAWKGHAFMRSSLINVIHTSNFQRNRPKPYSRRKRAKFKSREKPQFRVGVPGVGPAAEPDGAALLDDGAVAGRLVHHRDRPLRRQRRQSQQQKHSRIHDGSQNSLRVNVTLSQVR